MLGCAVFERCSNGNQYPGEINARAGKESCAVAGEAICAVPPPIHMTPKLLLDREMGTWMRARTLIDSFRDKLVEASNAPEWYANALPDFPVVEEAVVARAIAKRQEVAGGLTVWDYFQPPGLGIPHGLALLASLGSPLWQSFGHEDWRTWDAEFLPTEAGIMTCYFDRVGTVWDGQFRPFNLDRDGHINWAKEKGVGGDTIHSVEEALIRNFRGTEAMGYPVGFNGSERCRNTVGDCAGSLCVSWRAGRGLRVDGWDSFSGRWHLGAFPRKFVAVDQ